MIIAYFRTRLNRIAVSKEIKKDVNAIIEFFGAVVHGHWLACACEIVGISNINGAVTLPARLKKATSKE